MKERKALNAQVTTTVKKSTTFTPPATLAPVLTLGSRPLVDAYSDDDDEDESKKSQKGVSIAPPPSLIESTNSTTTSTFNSVPPPPIQSTNNTDTSSLNMNVSGVAAKIMAKMGYKEGEFVHCFNFRPILYSSQITNR